MKIKLEYSATVEKGTIQMGPIMRKRMVSEVSKAFPDTKIVMTIDLAKQVLKAA